MIGRSVHLQCRDWSAVVLPEFGANAVRLRYKDRDVLHTPVNAEQLRREPWLYGTPLLMPPNRVEDGTFSFDGETYRLEINEPRHRNHIHGFLATAPFAVEELSGNRVVCVHENKGGRYPFPFRMTVISSLGEEGFLQQIELHNPSNADIPVMLGLHTAFAEPETFSVPIGRRWETSDRHIPTGKLLELDERERGYVRGSRSIGVAISGFYTAAGHTAHIGDYRYRVSEMFTQWVLYNGGGGKGFLCIEPQSGPVNGLNRPDGYIRLKKKESVRFWAAISRGGEQPCRK
ncbi:aldose 1-epimerase [Paenibacillaceae bacterium WGS1546]|uniref:aldose 1-epimerase n=1 Tax=Cohnella sp. WGS1546 TaxID=3366810 RepID=UPI00372D3651